MRRRCRRAFYSLCKRLSLLAAVILFDTRVYGGARVPRRGACLIASTHQSYLDPWIVGMSVPRRCAYLARESLFRVPLLGRLIGALGAVPIPRGSAASRGALDTGIRLLRDEEALLVFPEGTRSEDGLFQPFKRGVALMARRTGAPVVPVLVVGTYDLWPRGRRFPRLSFPWITLPRRLHRSGDGRDLGREASGATRRRAAIRIYFGEPIEFGEDEDLDLFTTRLRAACEELARHAGVPEICGDAQPQSEEMRTTRSVKSVRCALGRRRAGRLQESLRRVERFDAAMPDELRPVAATIAARAGSPAHPGPGGDTLSLPRSCAASGRKEPFLEWLPMRC